MRRDSLLDRVRSGIWKSESLHVVEGAEKVWAWLMM